VLSQANTEIRRFLDAAEERQRRKRETEAPMRYLDWVLGRLEAYRLQGQTRVPPAFQAQLERTPIALPPGVKSPKHWGNRIGWAAEQCFRLQGQLLRLRRGDFGQDRTADDRPDPVSLHRPMAATLRLRPSLAVRPSADRLWWAAHRRIGRDALALVPARQQPHLYP
jgi:hypothetical protein